MDRLAPDAIIGWLWIAFVLYWLILAQFNKRASRSAAMTGWGARLLILAGVLLVLWFRRHAPLRLGGPIGPIGPVGRIVSIHAGAAVQWLGVGLCLAGFGFAFWARAHLGRNWGMPMSLRQGHELVTSGPYAYVRHPIYTGIMLAMLGSALTVGIQWLALFLLYFAYFLFSARTEEKTMLEQFPDTYPAYRRRTRMLIPFVF
jgi:Isoprenylcysteine carboxyl methyltransferase (ICMT) family